jgi:sugar phosphate isomerase/epimerase
LELDGKAAILTGTNHQKVTRRLMPARPLSANVPVSINGPENFSFRTEEELLRVLERTKRISRVCTTISCPMLIAVPSLVKGKKSRDETVSETATSLKRVIEAYDSGIKVGLEFLGIRNCSVADLLLATEVLRKVGGDRVGLVRDTFHLHLSRATSAGLERIPLRELLLVHINDSEQLPLEQLTDGNRVLPGRVARSPSTPLEANTPGYHVFLRQIAAIDRTFWQRQTINNVSKLTPKGVTS